MDTKLTRRTLLLAAGAAAAAPLLPAVAPAEPMVSAADTIHVTMTAAAMKRPLGILVDIQHSGIISFMGVDKDDKHIRVDFEGDGTRRTVELPSEFKGKPFSLTIFSHGGPFRCFRAIYGSAGCSDSPLTCNLLRMPRLDAVHYKR